MNSLNLSSFVRPRSEASDLRKSPAQRSKGKKKEKKRKKRSIRHARYYPATITPSHGRVRLVRPFWAITFALCLFPFFPTPFHFPSLSPVRAYVRAYVCMCLSFLFLFLNNNIYIYKHAILHRVASSFRRSSRSEAKARADGSSPEKREEMTLSSLFSRSLVGTSSPDPRAVRKRTSGRCTISARNHSPLLGARSAISRNGNKRSLGRQSIFYTNNFSKRGTSVCHDAVLPRRERCGTMKKRNDNPAATVSRNVAPIWRKMKTSSFDVIITCSPWDKIVNYIFTDL